jgi:hypothetical protein
VFSDAENQKLCGIYKLTEAQLNDVLETSGYVFEQCAYLGVSANAIKKEYGNFCFFFFIFFLCFEKDWASWVSRQS